MKILPLVLAFMIGAPFAVLSRAESRPSNAENQAEASTQLAADEAVPQPELLRVPFDEKTAKAAQEAWIRHLGAPKLVERNSIEMEFVLIPPGRFTMGRPKTDRDRGRLTNPVEVTLTRPFSLSRTEVTQAHWQKLMGTTPWKSYEHTRSGENYPAVSMHAEDANEYCKRLTLKEKDGTTYRLPTEAEWEYACRAGTTTRYSFGDDVAALDQYGWYGRSEGDGSAKNSTFAHEVGLKKPNPFGLFDMHGNVWEWSRDFYDEKLTGGVDPTGPAKGNYRVFRGGAWDSNAAGCGSAFRSGAFTYDREIDVGFRVARVLTTK